MQERDHQWLKKRLEYIWENHFPDIAIKNNVFVKFGRRTACRLGSIKMARCADAHTIITINGHFKDSNIPEYVVDAVLAHELTHYAHGFCSPHKQAFRHPHKNGIVRKELIDRGLNDLLKAEKKWIKINWREYIRKNYF